MKKIWLALALCFPFIANATPITWELVDMRIGFYTVTSPGGPFSRDFTTDLTGSFVYDADTDLYSNVNITANAGPALRCITPSGTTCAGAVITSLPETHYDTPANLSPFTTPSSLVSFVNATLPDGLLGDPLLYIAFESALTNAGGSIFVNSTGPGLEFLCGAVPACNFDITRDTYRRIIGVDVTDSSGNIVITRGKIVSVSVPEPTSMALFGIGGLLFGLRRGRRKQGESASR